MRKLLTTAVAVAMLGLGVSSVKASSSPIEAIQAAAPVLATPGSPGTNGYNYQNYDSGAELAGLVHAYRSGGNSSTVRTAISTLSQQLITDSNTNSDGRYGGDQAYGLVVAGQTHLAGTSGNLAAITAFYTTTYLTAGQGPSFQAYADYAGSLSGDPTNPSGDNGIVWDLGFHVLATHTLGSAFNSQNAAFSNTLLTELGYFDTTTGGDITVGEFSANEVLAVALWGLKSSGYADNTTTANGGGNWGDMQLGDLAALLKQTLDDDIAAGSVFTEDLSYGILALQAYGYDVSAYQLLLASGVDAAGLATAGAVPQSIDTLSPYSYNNLTPVGSAYSGAALQALPEPASLSFLGLGAMGLLARRRRA